MFGSTEVHSRRLALLLLGSPGERRVAPSHNHGELRASCRQVWRRDGGPQEGAVMRSDQTASTDGRQLPELDGLDLLHWSAGSRPADGRLADVELAMDPTAPAVARRIVSTCLAGSVVPLVMENARLIVSELVTNSLRHSGVPVGGQL